MFVPPFDDPLVVAGQGTVGLELATEAPESRGDRRSRLAVAGLIGGMAVASPTACRTRGSWASRRRAPHAWHAAFGSTEGP